MISWYEHTFCIICPLWGNPSTSSGFHSQRVSDVSLNKLLNKHLRYPLQWRHNECDGISNHQPHDCLLNRLFRRISKKTSKPRITGLCARNSPVTGDFPAQMASNVENVSIWWHHHALLSDTMMLMWRHCNVDGSFWIVFNSCFTTITFLLKYSWYPHHSSSLRIRYRVLYYMK